MVQIVKSQCPMNREFPVVFKTHPTFICGLIFKASRSLQTKPDMLSGGSCTYVQILHAIDLYCQAPLVTQPPHANTGPIVTPSGHATF